MRRRHVRLAVAACSAAIVFAACSGNDVETGKVAGRAGGKPVAGARAITVQASNFEFSPDRLSVKAGDELAFRLQSEDSSHDFAIDGLGRVAEVGGGETTTARLRIDDPGTYAYFCTVPGHRDGGMEGTIVVR